MEEETVITEEKQKSHLFQKGESGNPNGRPKGTFSLKTLIIRKLEEQPELREKLIADLFDRDQSLVWQMIDGKPVQKNEVELEATVTQGVVMLPNKNERLDTTE